MKMKKLFAMCCCALLLVGCESSTGRSESTESSKIESVSGQQTSSSTESKTSMSQTSTTIIETSSSSEQNGENFKDPEITFTTILNNDGYYEDVWDYVFYDDPAVYGEWECIGTIDADELDAWIARSSQSSDEYVGMMAKIKFSPDGSVLLTYQSGKTHSASWTRGYVCHNIACPSVSRIVTKTFNNEDYLAFEHKSGDYAKNKDVFCYFIFKRLKTEDQSLDNAQSITTTGDGMNGNSASNVQRHTLTFGTMLAAVNGSQFETMAGYPDYSSVESYLAMGIQPDYIDVDVYYYCPYCGSENYCTTVSYSYNEGELNLIPNVHCENRNCSHYYEMHGVMLFSHIESSSTISSSSSISQPSSSPTVSLSGSNLIGLTLRDGLSVHGHELSEYKRFAEDTDIVGYYIIDDIDGDDGIIFFTNYTFTSEALDEKIIGVRVSGKNIPISSGYGNIDNTRIGISKEEMYNVLGNDINLRENDDDYVWFINKNGLTFEFWFDTYDNVQCCEIY